MNELQFEKNKALKELIKQCAEKVNLVGVKLEAIEQVAGVLVAEGVYTQEKMIEYMQQVARMEGADPSKVVIGKVDESYIEGIKSTVSQQKRHFFPEDIKEREEVWKAIGIYSQDEIDKMKETAELNEIERQTNIAGKKRELESAKSELVIARKKLSEAEKPAETESEKRKREFREGLDAREDLAEDEEKTSNDGEGISEREPEEEERD